MTTYATRTSAGDQIEGTACGDCSAEFAAMPDTARLWQVGNQNEFVVLCDECGANYPAVREQTRPTPSVVSMVIIRSD